MQSQQLLHRDIPRICLPIVYLTIICLPIVYLPIVYLSVVDECLALVSLVEEISNLWEVSPDS